MCADPGHFADEIAALELAGADSFHIDIMDGEFVPNFALSWAEVSRFGTLTRLPLEAHLMVRNIDVHIGFAHSSGVKLVYLHAEHPDVMHGLIRTRELGMQVGLAVNPATKLEALLPFTELIDSILMMRVHPGFAGQRAVLEGEARLEQLHNMFPAASITVDGAVNPEVIPDMSRKGATSFVLGTSSLFGKNQPYREILSHLRSLSR